MTKRRRGGTRVVVGKARTRSQESFSETLRPANLEKRTPILYHVREDEDRISQTTTRIAVAGGKVQSNLDFESVQIVNGAVELNNLGIDKYGDLQTLKKVQFLYLRDNFINSFANVVLYDKLRILDLSGNQIESLEGFPQLPNLTQLFLDGNRITSFEYLPPMEKLEVLSLGSNLIEDFSDYPRLPNLAVLSVRDNKIASFKGFPCSPSLTTVFLSGNPVCESMSNWRVAFLLVCGPSLHKLDGVEFTEAEHQLFAQLGAKAQFCLREGWLLPETISDIHALEDDLDQFLNKVQRIRSESRTIYVSNGTFQNVPRPHFMPHDHRPYREGDDLFVKLCLVHNNLQEKEFFSTHLQSVSITFTGEGKHVAAFGSFNKFEEGLPLVKTGEQTWGAILYLTPGTYYYYFVVNKEQSALEYGRDTFRLPEKEMVTEERPLCHALVVEEIQEPAEGDRRFALARDLGYFEYQWFRSNDELAFELMEDQNSPSYTPNYFDIGRWIMAKVTPVSPSGRRHEPCLSISRVIEPGLPECTSLDIKNMSVVDSKTGNTISKRRGRSDLIREGDVLGVFTEYFGGDEGDSFVKWYRRGQFSETCVSQFSDFAPDLDDVGHELRAEFTPVRSDGVRGAPVSREFVVFSAFPEISALHMTGVLQEGSEISVLYDYFGGREEDSLFEWYRQRVPDHYFHVDNDSDIGQFELVASGRGRNSYPMTLDDVGCRLLCKVTPRNTEGMTGTFSSCVSEAVVAPAAPEFRDIKLLGECLESRTLSLDYTYTGGFEGQSLFEWCHIMYPDGDDGAPQWVSIEGANQRSYVLNKYDCNKEVGVRSIAVRDDGVQSSVVYSVASGVPVVPGKPEVVSMNVEGEWQEGEIVRASHTYFGGEEGNSTYVWARMVGDEAILIEDNLSDNGSAYQLQNEDVGHIVMVECLPVSSTGQKGTPKGFESPHPVQPAIPIIKSVDLGGVFEEGQVLEAQYVYSGGVEGESVIEWFRTSPGGSCSKRDSVSGKEYPLTIDDIGCTISYTVTPVRHDGLTGEPVSLQADPSKVVMSLPPVGVSLELPSTAKECDILEPVTVYQGGKEGASEFRWLRDGEQISSSKVHEVGPEDVSHELTLIWTPVRSDGERGQPLEHTITNITSGEPQVRVLELSGLPKEGSTLFVDAQYGGGTAGESLLEWARVKPDGSGCVPLPELNNVREYSVTVDDAGYCIQVKFTPVRFDGLAGEPKIVLSEEVRSCDPEAFDPEIVGDVKEGGQLRGRAQYRGGRQGNSTFKWFRVEGRDEFVEVGSGPTYRIKTADSGKRLRFEFTPVRDDGVAGQPVRKTTDPVTAGEPTFLQAFIVLPGKGRTNGPLVAGVPVEVVATYQGGHPGEHKFQWQRSADGRDFQNIDGASRSLYRPSVDDLGCLVRVEATPVRADGKAGQTVCSEAFTVGLTQQFRSIVGELLEHGYSVLPVKSRSGPARLMLNRKNVEVRLSAEGNKSDAKENWNPETTTIRTDPRNPKALLVKVAGQDFQFEAADEQSQLLFATLFRAQCGLATDQVADAMLGGSGNGNTFANAKEFSSMVKKVTQVSQAPMEVRKVASLSSQANQNSKALQALMQASTPVQQAFVLETSGEASGSGVGSSDTQEEDTVGAQSSGAGVSAESVHVDLVESAPEESATTPSEQKTTLPPAESLKGAPPAGGSCSIM